MPHGIELGGIDYVILVVYFLFVLGIGLALRRQTKTSEDFFLSGRSIPAWIAGLAFLSANLGAQEMIGMAASGAKYGIATSHFYWVGAIPAMVFVGVFMMPFYYGSRARSVPEYLKLRFDEKTRAFNAVSFAAMTVFSSGISMYALAKLLELLLGWDFNVSLWVSALIVLAYIYLGGLTSAIYNEVLQFFLIVLGLRAARVPGPARRGRLGRARGEARRRRDRERLRRRAPGATPGRTWAAPRRNPMGVEWFGMAMGLGFVLSFGYWCTDFLVVQRAMAADSMAAARRTPLIAAVPKMLFPFLIIVPGMIAIGLTHAGSGFALPKMADGSWDYTMVIPQMLAHYFPPGILGLGLTALMASFMSGMAGNVTAFNTVWTYDIYQSHIKKDATDAHLLWVGRMTTVFGILASVGTAYLAAQFNNIMDFLQLVFAFVNAPLFATFLLGMFWRRATGHGAFFGLVLGTLAAALHHGLTLPAGAPVGIKGGWLAAHAASRLLERDGAELLDRDLGLLRLLRGHDRDLARDAPAEDRRGPRRASSTRSRARPREEHLAWWKTPEGLGALVLALAIALNVIFW